MIKRLNGRWRCQVSGGDRMNKAPVNEIGAQNDGLACSQTPELKLRLEDGSKGPLRFMGTLQAVAPEIAGKLRLWRLLESIAKSLQRSRRLIVVE